jgi:hypothetical protein
MPNKTGSFISWITLSREKFRLCKHSQISNRVTLRTDTLAADEFYQKLRFQIHPNWEHMTHHLQLSEIELVLS